MARRPRASYLENRTSRLKLPIAKKPHCFTSIAPGIALGYRRCKSAGSWVVRVANGKGGHWTKALDQPADDFETADGEHVFSWYQAIDKARQLARGQTDESARPATWATALADYEADLRARGGSPRNASHVRYHLAGTALINKPVALLTAAELKRWRNDMLARGVQPQTVVRVLKSARASLNYAANHDPRIQNRDAWRIGLSGLNDVYTPVNRVLADDDVLRIVAESYKLDPAYGLFIDTLASTGTRTSQACGLLVADLQADGPAPRVMMPSSRKGKGTRRIERKPVPITRALALKLKEAAGDRDPGEPLLTRADGTAWSPRRHELQTLFAEVAARAGVGGTAYQLRHSSIVRSLLAGTPARVTAAQHDTSTIILEKVYSHFILDHADTVARRGILDTGAPAAANVVALARAKGSPSGTQ